MWSWHSQGEEVYTSFDSILSLVETHTAIWATFGSLDAADALTVDHFIAEQNPLSFGPGGEVLRSRGAYDTKGWPDSWLRAAGIGDLTPSTFAPTPIGDLVGTAVRSGILATRLAPLDR